MHVLAQRAWAGLSLTVAVGSQCERYMHEVMGSALQLVRGSLYRFLYRVIIQVTDHTCPGVGAVSASFRLTFT